MFFQQICKSSKRITSCSRTFLKHMQGVIRATNQTSVSEPHEENEFRKTQSATAINVNSAHQVGHDLFKQDSFLARPTPPTTQMSGH